MDDLNTRARMGMAVNARDVADEARGVLGDACAPLPRGELIAKTRRVRALAQALVDRAVMAEIAGGASWSDLADALGMPAEDCHRIYAPTWEVWLEHGSEPELDRGDREVGTGRDFDPEGTAESLDQWWRRHAEPWESADRPRPVGTLVDGQASPGDR